MSTDEASQKPKEIERKLMEEINKLMTDPDNLKNLFLENTGFAWAAFIPMVLLIRRTDYVYYPDVPNTEKYEKAEKEATDSTIVNGMVVFYDSATINTFLISDWIRRGLSTIVVLFPYSESEFAGRIEAEVGTKGFISKKIVLTGVKLYFNNDKLKRSIENDNSLMELIKEYFSSIVYWSNAYMIRPNNDFYKTFRESVIHLHTTTYENNKYYTLVYTLPRINEVGINLLEQEGIDIWRIPVLLFDISKGIARKVLQEVK
jgi:hypothetical protein